MHYHWFQHKALVCSQLFKADSFFWELSMKGVIKVLANFYANKKKPICTSLMFCWVSFSLTRAASPKKFSRYIFKVSLLCLWKNLKIIMDIDMCRLSRVRDTDRNRCASSSWLRGEGCTTSSAAREIGFRGHVAGCIWRKRTSSMARTLLIDWHASHDDFWGPYPRKNVTKFKSLKNNASHRVLKKTI